MKSIDLIIEALNRKGILTEKTFKNRYSKIFKKRKSFIKKRIKRVLKEKKRG
ncbi:MULTISPECIES: hypothetical protein [Bacillus]|uniref:hypothetical protein n=1 Tax=Bacillus TaxID=1386 RepID=UPI002248FC10|nr:hypothetical protein [Bacillus sp. ChL18]MCX2808791.1 hypothetical protein [Bacillus sp. ChL18]